MKGNIFESAEFWFWVILVSMVICPCMAMYCIGRVTVVWLLKRKKWTNDKEEDDESENIDKNDEFNVPPWDEIGIDGWKPAPDRAPPREISTLQTFSIKWLVVEQEEESEVSWFLEGEHGQEHGPFSQSRMRLWHEQGHFNAQSRVKRNDQNAMSSIGDMFPRLERAFAAKTKKR
eukprot:GEMP01062524.1.p1 GENE.GEMP01062524.1~~GEMP01062524.1.p1  ORF type:complete len:175 (+),score=42.80 GEMP01062524.1:91-615(+)